MQFKSDARNQRSHKALERIGAVKEGVLRKQMIVVDGHIRDSISYRIIDSEWPSIKENLEEKMSQ